MDNDRFDDFSKTLATNGLSRRRFAQRLGGGLVGVVLANLGLRQATAAQGNSEGAKWCHQHFAGRAAGKCTSAATNGQGPFYECGPASDGSLMLCGTVCAECCGGADCPSGTCNPDGTCASPLSCEDQDLQTCGDECIATTECCGDCPSGTICIDGACQSQHTEPATCDADSACGDACENAPADTDTVRCQCGRTIEGSPVCYNYWAGIGCSGHFCTGDSDCTGDYGDDSTCLNDYCTTPNNYCASDDACGPGFACVNRNNGCGGCDAYTGGLGICTPVCTAA